MMRIMRNKLALLRSVSALGSGMLAKCFVGGVFLYYYLADSLHLPVAPCRLHLLINGAQCGVQVRRISDFWVMKDVLVDREYETQLADLSVIVDLGANIGIAALFFATKYPNAIVYAVEPNPYIFEDLRANTSGFGNIRTSRVAIAGDEGELRLYSGRSGAGSSIIQRGDSERQYTVPSMTMDGFLHTNNLGRVDLLKFDIEGAETVIFRGFKGFTNVRSYVGEVHYDLSDLTPGEIRDRAAEYSVEERYVRKDRSIISLRLQHD